MNMANNYVFILLVILQLIKGVYKKVIAGIQY